MITKVVIPAKGNSVRVPNKNLRPFFNEKSLLEICVEKVKTLRLPVVVNSEDPEILELAERLGVTAQKRPLSLAQPETTPAELARHIAEKNADADYILYTHCTNPLISVESFKSVLAIPPSRWRGRDSINSAYFVQKHLWDVKIPNSPIPLYDNTNRPATQGLKNIVALEYSVNLISTARMFQRSDFVGTFPAFVMIPHNEVIDIDEEIDFEIAQNLYAKRNKAFEGQHTMNVVRKDGMGTGSLRHQI